MGDFGGCELLEKKSRRPQRDGSFGRTPRYDAASRRMIEHTEIESRPHANWIRKKSRVLRALRRAERGVEPCCLWLSLWACEGNRRLRRPVKGAPLRGRAELALDRPTRR